MGVYYYDSGVLSKKITVHHTITSITIKIMNEQRAQAYVNWLFVTWYGSIGGHKK